MKKLIWTNQTVFKLGYFTLGIFPVCVFNSLLFHTEASIRRLYCAAAAAAAGPIPSPIPNRLVCLFYNKLFVWLNRILVVFHLNSKYHFQFLFLRTIAHTHTHTLMAGQTVAKARCQSFYEHWNIVPMIILFIIIIINAI